MLEANRFSTQAFPNATGGGTRISGRGRFVAYGVVNDGEFPESGATNDGSFVAMSEY